MTSKNPKSLYLIDGTALAYRSYFAFIKNPLINSRGMSTGAVFGFTNMLLKILKEVKPDYLAAVFDSKEPTFRHKMYKEYKATREKMPDEMIDQLPYIARVVKALSVPHIILPSYEADDIIATIAVRHASKDLKVSMVTGDKDLMQFVSEDIVMLVPKKGGEVEIVDEKAVKDKFGVPPGKMRDLLSLMGDSSDNIPGVPGVGGKTALKLLEQFGSLDDILAKPEKIENKKLADSIKSNREIALLSKELVTIDTKVPIDDSLEKLKVLEPDRTELFELFKELEFHSMLEKLDLKDTGKRDKTDYKIIDSKEELDDLIKGIRKSSKFVFDTETTGINPIDAKIVGISFCISERKAYYLPFNLKEPGKGFHPEDLIKAVRPVFEDPTVKKGGHNTKFDTLVLKNAGIDTKGVSFDTMIESYLLDPSARQHNLDLVALKNLKYQKIPIEDLIGKGASAIGMESVDIEKVAEYSCEDADITMRLHNLFAPQIESLHLGNLYKEVEIPLIEVLSSMEEEGVKVDPSLLKSLSERVEAELSGIRAEIYKEAKGEFNINSHKQLGSVLFDKLKIHEALGVRKIKKTKTGYSTDSEFLETLSEHPIVDSIIRYKNLSKLASTYLDALPLLINKRTGRIHTSFNQTVTATGRLSSSEPNLQNIPIRTEVGREIRKAFVTRSKDWSMVSADYSQIELRILAELSRDKNLIETFKEGVDVHSRTAAAIFGLRDNEVPVEMRSRAKAINFGIIYGMGPQRLARETKIPLVEAQKFIDSYFENYPGIKIFIENQIAEARTKGFVTTILGRRRYVPDISSDNPRFRINAEHIAVNTPIQGSAADMIKIAMIRIHNRLRKERFKCRMILQVHDELVFETPDDEIKSVMRLVKEEMENAIPLEVPVKVEIKSGKNWFEAH